VGNNAAVKSVVSRERDGGLRRHGHTSSALGERRCGVERGRGVVACPVDDRVFSHQRELSNLRVHPERSRSLNQILDKRSVRVHALPPLLGIEQPELPSSRELGGVDAAGHDAEGEAERRREADSGLGRLEKGGNREKRRRRKRGVEEDESKSGGRKGGRKVRRKNTERKRGEKEEREERKESTSSLVSLLYVFRSHSLSLLPWSGCIATIIVAEDREEETSGTFVGNEK